MFEFSDDIRRELNAMASGGTYKSERLLDTPQGASLRVDDQQILNFCSNNYLGLSNHRYVVESAKKALDKWGFGLASVRSICGTQTQHADLESALSTLLGTEATILYSSCFDANGGVFEVLLGEDDAVISDELNHASIIDGIRLCKASRHRYRNRNMGELEACLQACSGARRRLIVTDGIFSMDGSAAPLVEICGLADRYGALVMVDDSHAVGIMGQTGAGTPEAAGVQGRVDIVSGTLGKALGGASGGYISGCAEIISLLRQRSRPYMFSNTLPPPVVAGSIAALELVTSSTSARRQLDENAKLFRQRMEEEGFALLPGSHPIVPVMFGDAAVAKRVAASMFDEGVLVIAFGYPVVPEGSARIRVQLSAGHTPDNVETCVQAFVRAARGATRLTTKWPKA